MICPFCKEIVQDGAIKCKHCASMLNLDPDNTIHVDTITSDEIRAFVGPNSYYYIQKFSNFTILGSEKFCITWNWSCCGFTFLWFLYRKMYTLALITFVVFCIPGINFFLHIVVGCIGNYLYYRHVKSKIGVIRSTTSFQNFIPLLHETGGVNRWVYTLGIVLCIFMAALIFMFFASITTYVIHSIPRITI